MFTGIVQAIGVVSFVEQGKLGLSAVPNFGPPVLGESIAVNGCCLTVSSELQFSFDLSVETLARTTLGQLEIGDSVNLERALLPTNRIGGHFVQGHIDATGLIFAIHPLGNGFEIEFQVEETWDRYLINKGSVAIDGISLTVNNPERGHFNCSIIPQTWNDTNLRFRSQGDRVNLEFDLIAKHLEKLVAARTV